MSCALMKLNFFPSPVSSSFGPMPHGFFAMTTSPTSMSGMGAIRPFSSSLPVPTLSTLHRCNLGRSSEGTNSPDSFLGLPWMRSTRTMSYLHFHASGWAAFSSSTSRPTPAPPRKSFFPVRPQYSASFSESCVWGMDMDRLVVVPPAVRPGAGAEWKAPAEEAAPAAATRRKNLVMLRCFGVFESRGRCSKLDRCGDKISGSTERVVVREMVY
mmetsp:Transcript_29873/g.55545  ORF Transcript_29873/g.55545 Transcript_29873/m.55545 type:complete len:213 (-) Transcript_29873:96-734(-)